LTLTTTTTTMSRRYPTAELYEERERDFYRNGRSDRNYEELDVELRRGAGPRSSAPESRSSKPPWWLR
jgi:hypothetical protein